MPLDESARRVLERMADAATVPIQDAPDLSAVRALASLNIRAIGLESPAGVTAHDEQLAPDASCAVRIYRPDGAGDAVLPAVLFAHGGGWVVGDLDSHDSICRHLALGARCVVVAVDYRLAPEHRFPAAYDDVVAALGWLDREAGRLRIDVGRVALCGDSAGANLVAAAAIHAVDRTGPLLLQILIYPVCDLAARSDSYLRNGAGYVLPAATMEFFISAYAPGTADRLDPRASPLRAKSLAASPPTILYTAEYDILHDEGVAFVHALRTAGVAATHHEVAGHMHGFMTMGRLLPVAARVIADVTADLRHAFGDPS